MVEDKANKHDVSEEMIWKEMPNLLTMLTSSIKPILLLPLEQMVDANERMQTLGPIIAPTAYINNGGKNLRDQRRLLDAALNLKRIVLELSNDS